MNRSYVKGYNAYVRGKGMLANPHFGGSDSDRRDWERGWKDAWDDNHGKPGGTEIEDQEEPMTIYEQQGRNAYNSPYPLTNPYHPDTTAHKEWYSGYQQAALEADMNVKNNTTTSGAEETKAEVSLKGCLAALFLLLTFFSVTIIGSVYLIFAA